MARQSAVAIIPADTPDQFEQGRRLFREYAQALSFDLRFQDFARELEQLTRMYGLPEGRLLLAYLGNELVGCVGVRKFETGICEMKRMYVRAESRGLGIGRQMAEAAIVVGRALGYPRMRLDTVPGMTTAIRLYESLGFRDIPAYRPNPVPGARFKELVLQLKPVHFGR
jgi:ribosomal protein S18 acetylase RimI-like enzyme